MTSLEGFPPEDDLQIRAREGSPLSDRDARELYPELRQLAEEEEGVTADRVVDRAEDPDSVLHDHFEWDDRVAAHRYRLSQARDILRSIEVEIIDTGGSKRRVREFHVVQGNGDRDQEESSGSGSRKKGRYMTVDQVNKSERRRKEVVGKALRQLFSWHSTYEDYRHVFNLEEERDLIDLLDLIGELREENGDEDKEGEDE